MTARRLHVAMPARSVFILSKRGWLVVAVAAAAYAAFAMGAWTLWLFIEWVAP